MKKALTILLICIVSNSLFAQKSISFQHLNTSNGLSYLGVNDMCVDKKGNLWLGTGNGLNMFNGKKVDKYFTAEYPQLRNNNIVHVTCDKANRIWVLTTGGNATVLDEKRQMHRVAIYRNDSLARVSWVMNSQNGRIILWTNKGFYLANQKLVLKDSLTNDDFSPLAIKDWGMMGRAPYQQVFYFDEDSYIFVREDAFCSVNFSTRTTSKKYLIPATTALIKWGPDELLAYDRTAEELKVINLVTEQVSYPFRGLKDQFGNPVKSRFYFTEKINEDEYVMTTHSDGIYIYNRRTNKIYNYRHSVSDPSSISANRQSSIATGYKGWVFITCSSSGISYFNRNDIIGNQSVFTDGTGNGYDGYLMGIATTDNNTYFIGTGEGLLEWKRDINHTTFINFPGKNDGKLLKKDEVSSIVIDNDGKIWSSTLTQGLFVIDKNKNKNLVRQVLNTDKGKFRIKQKRIPCIVKSAEGDIWVCGGGGISKINPRTFEVENFENTPLAALDSIYTMPLFFSDKDNLWIGTSGKGVYHYNLVTQKLENFNTKKGLAGDGIFCLNADKDKNIFVGARTGLSILYANGRIKSFTQKDGLLIDRVEGLLLDKRNRMWIGNDIGLVCYNPVDSSFTSFDQRYGLSIFGFRVGSYFQTPNGEFAFGTPKGLQYFQPDSLFTLKIPLNALINKIETENIVANITESTTFDLPASANQVTFYFSSVDYSPHLRTYYEYQLSAIDKDWIRLADQNSVRYNSLPPGKYLFRVRVSNDNKNWQNADNEVTIIIATPFYKTWWFRVAGFLLGFSLIWGVINYYRKKQRSQKEQLETEVVVNYFASQINSHKNINDLLWDIAKNCISKLHFEDCVIYLKDDKRNVLVQKAAYGPKNPVDFTIHQPMEIAVGGGIVGAVAESGKAELISNTAMDPRYIVDDASRLSEIAVPIIIDRKVIGVIDSEHPQKNFFTARHLQILSTVAALCANQIQRAKAEEEKQTAKIEVLENKQKATESRLQSLRLQMNPHFLFNALNSIQQMILANEDIVATKYLSRFSKLLRAILVHSDKETITLKEELDILNLYIELESIRFKELFNYQVRVDEEIETDEVKIPTLLVQPFVENAIWHGLMHKEGERKLTVAFTEEGDFIKCIVEDNGVGRQKASDMKVSAGQDKKHVSKGIAVSNERLKAMRTKDGREGTIEIIDLTDAAGQPSGTRVQIYFPIQN